MLRDILHQGIWKYKPEDFIPRKFNQLQSQRDRVELFQEHFESILGNQILNEQHLFTMMSNS